MANYNYTTIEQIMGSVERAFACPNVEFSITSSRGNVVKVELREWVAECGPREGEVIRMFSYHGSGSSGSKRPEDMRNFETVASILLSLDAYLKVGKEYKRLYRDIVPVNRNGGYLMDVVTGEVII